MSIISSDELYVFYNHTNPQYWTENQTRLIQYNKIIHDAVFLTLYNITDHSMNISLEYPYSDQLWLYGGITNWIPCMVFNIKLNNAPNHCPTISNPQSIHAQYVAVVKYDIKANGDLDAFKEYIYDILDSTEYLLLFNKLLRGLDDTFDWISTETVTEPSTSVESIDIDINNTAHTINTMDNEQISSQYKDIYIFNEKQLPIGLAIISVVLCLVICVALVFIVGCIIRKHKRERDMNIVHSHVVLRQRDVELEDMDETEEEETTPHLLTAQSDRL